LRGIGTTLLIECLDSALTRALSRDILSIPSEGGGGADG
jgi:hypothetical protein